MAQGTIKKLVSDRGFGFISSPSGDIFFHHSVVVDNKFDELKEGQAVTYEITTGPDERGRDKGPRGLRGPGLAAHSVECRSFRDSLSHRGPMLEGNISSLLRTSPDGYCPSGK